MSSTIQSPVKAASFILARDPEAPPLGLEGAVYVIGNFDGVHLGHQSVIAQAMALAKTLGRPCALLTFEPHPGDYFAGGPSVFRLTPEKVKARIMQRLGLSGMVVLSFNQNLASLSAEDFVRQILVERLGLSGAVVGYDFHFGRARSGTPEFLHEAGLRHGFVVQTATKVLADEKGSSEAVHSAATRQALKNGDVARARTLLGHDWFVLGEVLHGQKLGRTLGYPTANLALDPSCGLAYGIYAVRVGLEGAHYLGVASYGRRPTVDNGPPLLEVFIFDFSGDLYGRELEVSFVAWLRGEEKFDSLDALTAQIGRDVEQARAVLTR